jgi:hypothetical protein
MDTYVMDAHPKRTNRKIKLLPFAVAAAVLFAAGPALAGARLVAQIDEPFEINGETFDAGRIMLREMQSFSPIVMIHEVAIDGRSVGMVMSHPGSTTTPAERDELIFTRATEGHLVLTAVAFAGEPQRTLTRTPGQERFRAAGTLVARLP